MRPRVKKADEHSAPGKEAVDLLQASHERSGCHPHDIALPFREKNTHLQN